MFSLSHTQNPTALASRLSHSVSQKSERLPSSRKRDPIVKLCRSTLTSSVNSVHPDSKRFLRYSNVHLPTPLTYEQIVPSTAFGIWKYYSSKSVFSVRKAVEQDVSKLAYKQIVTKIKDKDEGLPDIFEKTMFFKSILNEFAAKMNLDKVTYDTVQNEGHPLFVSSLVFNCKSYIGDPPRSKMLAARTSFTLMIIG